MPCSPPPIPPNNFASACKTLRQLFQASNHPLPPFPLSSSRRHSRSKLCRLRPPAHPSASLPPPAHLHSLPSVLLSSALCRCGYWSASFLRAAWAHTMKAFMGRLMWSLGLDMLRAGGRAAGRGGAGRSAGTARRKRRRKRRRRRKKRRPGQPEELQARAQLIITVLRRRRPRREPRRGGARGGAERCGAERPAGRRGAARGARRAARRAASRRAQLRAGGGDAERRGAVQRRGAAASGLT